MLDIPVFHDDQHGTAIISLAGLQNYLVLSGKDIADIKIVISGGWRGLVSVSASCFAMLVHNISPCAIPRGSFTTAVMI